MKCSWLVLSEVTELIAVLTPSCPQLSVATPPQNWQQGEQKLRAIDYLCCKDKCSNLTSSYGTVFYIFKYLATPWPQHPRTGTNEKKIN